MSNRFPRVGVIGAGEFARMMVAPATDLGVDLLLFASDSRDSGAQITHHVVGDYTNLAQVLDFAQKCDVITLEHGLVPLSVIKGLEANGVKVYPSSSARTLLRDKAEMHKKLSNFPAGTLDSTNDTEIVVMVARSPHGQATSWAPVETIRKDGIVVMTIAPAQKISSAVAERAQQMALEIAGEIGVVGLMAVEILVKGEELFINELSMHPHISGQWSIEGAVTSQYEQLLRAILDLPLGSPAMNHPLVVTGNALGGEKTDMYRPYLHLMARTPSMHFHQYRKKDVTPGNSIGHITLCGENLPALMEEVGHARDYMSGVIDE